MGGYFLKDTIFTEKPIWQRPTGGFIGEFLLFIETCSLLVE